MTAARLLEEGRRLLNRARLPEAQASAEFLLAAALGCGRGELAARGCGEVAERHAQLYRRYLRRRAGRIPLAYILGSQPFMGLDIEVTSDVLIPRPETEEVVAAALVVARGIEAGLNRPVRILDLGTGSGCIALALAARLSDSFVVATDTSRPAIEIARRNARRLGLEGRVRFVQEDLFKPAPSASAAWADLVVSNPPYVPTARIPALELEVLREPRLALDGGKDGLAAVRAVARDAAVVLRPGGWLVIEIDGGQGERARKLLEAGGFGGVEVRRDIRGLERIVLGHRRLRGRGDLCSCPSRPSPECVKQA